MIDIINDDFMTRELRRGSMDLIVTSPPYDLGIDYGVTHEDKQASYATYINWSYRWLMRAYECGRTGTRLCLNIPLDTNKFGMRPVYSDLMEMAQKARWMYQSTIVWNEGNISRRTAWGSWKSASAPFVIAPVEMIAVLYKDQWKKPTKGISDITRDEFIAWTNGLWSFNGESAKRIGHPAPFPLELPKRCIKMFSYVGDVVLDPFAGSGSTLVAAKQLGRHGVGFEISPEYADLARKRVEEIDG